MKRHLKILRDRKEEKETTNDLRGLGTSEIFKNYHPRTYLLTNTDITADKELVEKFQGHLKVIDGKTLVNFANLNHKEAALNALLLSTLLHKKHSNLTTMIDYVIPTKELFEQEAHHEELFQKEALKHFDLNTTKGSKIHEACSAFYSQVGLDLSSQLKDGYYDFTQNEIESTIKHMSGLSQQNGLRRVG